MGVGIVILTVQNAPKHGCIKCPLTQGYFIAGCDRAAKERQQNHHIHGSGAHGVAPASLSLDQSSQQSDARSGAQTQPLSFDHFDIIIPPPNLDAQKLFFSVLWILMESAVIFPVSAKSDRVTKSLSFTSVSLNIVS